MTKSKKEEDSGENKEKSKEQAFSFEISSEYNDLIDDFSSIVNSGKNSFQESAEGRKIEYVSVYLASRYGAVIEVDKKGIPKIELTRLDVDNTGQKKIQKFLLGLRTEASTKSRSVKTVEFSGEDSNVKNFEVNSSAYETIKEVIRDAQKEGEKKQKKIDEEEIKYFPPLTTIGQPKLIDLEKELDINLNEITDLVVMARQIIKEELGSKLESVEVSFFKFGDSIIFVSSEGHKINHVIPRTGFVVRTKTKDNSEAFKCIRGVGGMEVLKKHSLDKSYKEIIEGLSKEVVKEVLDLDRAQDSGILGSECPVILSAEVAGVLAHEVFGHISEADIIIENKEKKNAEVNLKSRVGGQVSENTKLSVIDISKSEYTLGKKTFRCGFGTIVVDDMGTEGKDQVLVEGGIQINVLNSRYTFNEIIDGLADDIKAKIENSGLSGNLRSENYSYKPLVRMRNTCILPDENSELDTLEKIAAKIPKNKTGVYMKTTHGGWVDPDTGVFEITGGLCYLIQNSSIIWSKPLKNVRMSGNITKFGSKIKYIGTSNTIGAGTFTGYCGKDNQNVPVECVGPILYIEDATIGSVKKPSYWFDLYNEYKTQLSEVKFGKRDKEAVYFKDVEETSEKVGIKRKKSHFNVCMLTAVLSGDGEKKYILGAETKPDFSFSPGGKIKAEKGVY